MGWRDYIGDMEEMAKDLLKNIAGLTSDGASLVVAIMTSLIRAVDDMDLDNRAKKDIAVKYLDMILDALFKKDIPRWVSHVVIELLVGALKLFKAEDDSKPAPDTKPAPQPDPEPTPEPPVDSIYGNWESFPVPNDGTLLSRGYEVDDIIYQNMQGTQWVIIAPNEPRPYQAQWVRRIGE